MTSKTPRIMWIGDSPLLGTGFGVVTDGLMRHVRQDWEWVICGWRHQGDRIQLGRNMELVPFIRMENLAYWEEIYKPDIEIIYGSYEHLKNYAQSRSRRFTEPIKIPYLVVDIPGVPKEVWEVLDTAEHIMVPSEYSKKLLEEVQHDATVLPHGVDLNLFKQDMSRKRKDFSFGCMATNTFRKYHPRLIKAFAKVKGDCKLFLACHPQPVSGEPEIGHDLPELIKNDLGFNKAFFPYFATKTVMVDRSYLPTIYNSWNVQVSASSGEAFGLPYVESMACGVPNVTTDAGAAREVMGDAALYAKVLGYDYIAQGAMALVDIDDLAAKMQQIKDDDQLRKDLSEKGLERAKLFSWEKSARILEGVIEKFV